jgi:hypothetical protein
LDLPDFAAVHESGDGVRRDKAALSSGCMLRRYSILALIVTVGMISVAVPPTTAARAASFKSGHPDATGSPHPAAQLFGPVHCPTKFIRLWAMCAQLLPVEHIPGH